MNCVTAVFYEEIIFTIFNSRCDSREAIKKRSIFPFYFDRLPTKVFTM